MDRLRPFESEGDYPEAEEPRMDPPPAIGNDERRMHVRAYNHWVSLLDGRPYPSVADVDPAGLDDFGSHSVLIDFTAGPENPVIAFIGDALRNEDGHDSITIDIAQIQTDSLVSRLIRRCRHIMVSRAPIGFEAEFVNRRDRNTLYRGILLPLSSDGNAIDFVHGVINWKEAADASIVAGLVAEFTHAVPTCQGIPAWADGPNVRLVPSDILLETQFTAPVFGDKPGDGAVVRAAVAPLRRSADTAPTWVLPETRFARPTKGIVTAIGEKNADTDTGSSETRLAAARHALRRAAPLGSVRIGPVADEFVLLVARREANGALSILTPVSDAAMIDRAIEGTAG